MSILDEQDDGLENSLIDPFNVNISNEAYAFPVSDFIPSLKEEVPVVEEPIEEATIPPLPVNGSSNFDIDTDTPQDPLPAPDEGEEEPRISLEDEDGKEIEDDHHLVDELIQVRDRIQRLGGVSKNDVYQVEGLVPGLISSKRSINSFSTIPTPVGLSVSLESVSDKIIQGAKTVIKFIVDKIKSLIKLIDDFITSYTSAITLKKVESKWGDVITRVKRVDADGRRTAFLKKFGERSYAKSSSTNAHFFQLHADYLLGERTKEVPLYLRYIQSGRIEEEAVNAILKVNSLLDLTVRILQSGQNGNYKNDGVISLDYKDADDFKEKFAVMKESYRAKSKLDKKLFLNAIKAKDLIETQQKGIGDLKNRFNNVERELNKIENALGKSDLSEEASKALGDARTYIRQVGFEMQLIDYYLGCQEKYNLLMNAVVEICRKDAFLL